MKPINISFAPEKRKDKNTGFLVIDNVPLLADISYYGRIKPYTGIRLQHINDFDTIRQRLVPGKKAKFGSILLSPNELAAHLRDFEDKYYNTFKSLLNTGEFFTVKDIHNAIVSRRKAKQKGLKLANSSDIVTLADRYLKTKTIGQKRHQSYVYVADLITRYISIKNKNFNIANLSIDDVIDLSDFIENEHQYVEDNQDIYKNVSRVPRSPRKPNSVSNYLSVLSTALKDLKFPNPLADGDRSGKSLLTEKYDQPVYLTIDELLHCIDSDYPQDLRLDRDSFLVQCSIGLRVEDYQRVSNESLIMYKNGIPFISYTASKTLHNQKIIEVTETPILKFALDIINEYGYMPFKDYPVKLRALYNENIRKLLKYWGIDRLTSVRSENGIERIPIYTLGSSKIARKTYVDIITKSQLNPYLAGVHKEGSAAVKRYTDLSLEDKYKLYSMAFRQPI